MWSEIISSPSEDCATEKSGMCGACMITWFDVFQVVVLGINDQCSVFLFSSFLCFIASVYMCRVYFVCVTKALGIIPNNT